MALSAGGVFGVVVLVLFTPFSVLTSYLFYSRRDIQPIKARSPLLVLATDVILILYVILLCFQRIFEDDYPCALNLWSAYIGTIVLFNTYMWRCWTLFFSFYTTEERLKQASAEKATDTTSFFFRNTAYSKPAFLFKVTFTVFIILMIPCFAATGSTDSVGENVRHVVGLACDLGWSQTLIAAYVAIYVAFFVFFAVTLRSVEDNFRIKDELKLTGLIGILAVIPWLLFNRVSSMQTINKDTFPFSTLSLIIAVFAAFYLSTVWPLIRSYAAPAKVAEDAPEPAVGDLENLENIIKLKDGFDSFRKFLSAEFSVENLLFWKDVEDFRLKIKAGTTEAFIKTENTRLYEKYIVDDGPFQVNLKEEIVKKIKAVVEGETPLPKAAEAKAAEPAPVPTSDDSKGDVALGAVSTSAVTVTIKKDAQNFSPLAGEYPTCFDEAQAATFKLMKTDPFPRYKADPAYQQLLDKLSNSRRSTTTKK